MNNEEYLLIGIIKILVIHTLYHGIFSVSKKDIHKYLDHHYNPEAGYYFERA
jgi:hypothetical protein